jgi:hypothetical protein
VPECAVLLLAGRDALDGLGSGFMGEGAGDSSCSLRIKRKPQKKWSDKPYLDAAAGCSSGRVTGINVPERDEGAGINARKAQLTNLYATGTWRPKIGTLSASS